MSYLATAPPYVASDTPAAKGAAIARKEGRFADARLLDKAASGGAARWLTPSNAISSVASTVRAYAVGARAVGRTPVFVPYAIPDRDRGSYSAGGHAVRDYLEWTAQVCKGLDDTRSVVLLEPDSVLQAKSGGSNPWDRYAVLRTVAMAYAQTGAEVYLDGGSSNSFDWTDKHRADIAERLEAAGVRHVAGFYTNVANFQSTASEVAYANRIVQLLGGGKFIVDTSRNGNGHYKDPVTGQSVWCNPPGRALGERPRYVGEGAHVANLWVKTVGLSDGLSNGGPPAGKYWEEYLLGLAERAHW